MKQSTQWLRRRSSITNWTWLSDTQIKSALFCAGNRENTRQGLLDVALVICAVSLHLYLIWRNKCLITEISLACLKEILLWWNVFRKKNNCATPWEELSHTKLLPCSEVEQTIKRLKLSWSFSENLHQQYLVKAFDQVVLKWYKVFSLSAETRDGNTTHLNISFNAATTNRW